jgi:hypothetical protein
MPACEVVGDATAFRRQLAATFAEIDMDAADELWDRLEDDPRLMRRFGDAPARHARVILTAIRPLSVPMPLVRAGARSRPRERRAGTRSRTRSSRGSPRSTSGGDDPPPEPSPDLKRPPLSAELRAWLRSEVVRRRREAMNARLEVSEADRALFANDVAEELREA